MFNKSLKMILRFRVISYALLINTGIAFAGYAGFDEGAVAYRKQDFATAIREWKPLAQQGNVKAQSLVGGMYAEGQGVLQDYKEAAKWFRLAADQGSAFGQNNLGTMYSIGQGVPQDYKQAVRWFGLAADQGHPVAEYNLGGMYLKGQGVPQDYKEAVRWLGLAADQGHASAQNNLGSMYLKGQGVKPNRVIAYALYNLSAANDPSDRNNAMSNRTKLAEHMSDQEIEAGQDLTQQLSKPKNLVAALDEYIKKSKINSQ